MAARAEHKAGTALVLIPGSVNFFNNIAGQRLVEALRRLGWDVKLTSLQTYAGERADLAFLVSLYELFFACESPAQARANLKTLRRNCPRVMMWLLEPVHTPWFHNSFSLFLECGLDTLTDNALHDQRDELPEEHRGYYHHLFYGLTEAEKQQVRSLDFEDELRSIPWVFVGY